ncbi:hypothetical protein JK361_11805 [Streptomyces sp. 5-8]|uniref:Gram-positive cocci surface proteins LPxTG domain-containing protein n=1 Tax=Streptomyces musisoli TaxID=2802280 RepID=A0ABS1NZ33_9ACTN|nr:hypothetical protein [Streptomyces musisoli]MBY8843805.1 hypothetical protein [Streptomyces sp. SP2-10]
MPAAAKPAAVEPAAADPAAAKPAAAVPAAVQPACAGADARAFPLATRIRGGPGSYVAGGGYGTWYIDLTNTTRLTCAGVHPVVVLVDAKRALRANQPQLDFYDGSRALPVAFETTDANELVGVLDAPGFGGFTVPPGKTVSVRVRLALTSDTAPDEVTVSAAAVQRRDGDGEWVGESDAYRFAIAKEEGERQDTGDTQDTEEAEEAQDGRETQDAQDAQDVPGRQDAQDASGTPTASSGGVTPTPAVTGTPDSSPSLTQEAGEQAWQLAGTGPGLALGLLAVVVALSGLGAAAFLLARGRR